MIYRRHLAEKAGNIHCPNLCECALQEPFLNPWNKPKGTVYLTEETYRFGTDEIKSGGDNPFRCEGCEDYDDLAYER